MATKTQQRQERNKRIIELVNDEGLTMRQAAAAENVSHATVANVIAGAKAQTEILSGHDGEYALQVYVTNQKLRLAVKLVDAAHELADLVAGVAAELVAWDTKEGRWVTLAVEGLPPKERKEAAIALGITIDKLQLLTGEATERHETLSPQEAARKAAGLVDELERRRQAALGSNGNGRKVG